MRWLSYSSLLLCKYGSKTHTDHIAFPPGDRPCRPGATVCGQDERHTDSQDAVQDA